MKIAIGADHRGFALKEEVVTFLKAQGHEVVDKGAYELDPLDDYPLFAFAVAKVVANQQAERGILICGSSIGVTVAANKIDGIISSNPRTIEEAQEDRQHHNSNILALSSEHVSLVEAKDIINVWLETEFLGGKYQRRLDEIKEFEKNN